MTYSDHKHALNEIAGKISIYRKREIDQLAQEQTNANDMAALPAQYSGVVQSINDAAAAAPADEAVQAQKRDKDKLVADFQADNSRLSMRVAANQAIADALTAGHTAAAIETAITTALAAL